jgi:hypothetical protein
MSSGELRGAVTKKKRYVALSDLNKQMPGAPGPVLSFKAGDFIQVQPWLRFLSFFFFFFFSFSVR